MTMVLMAARHHSLIHKGLQGSGCLRDLQASGRFRLRTVTRSAKAAAAQALAAKGVEVLQGNLLDRPFLDRAMAGVEALFLATFSDHDGAEVCCLNGGKKCYRLSLAPLYNRRPSPLLDQKKGSPLQSPPQTNQVSQGKNLGDAAVAASVPLVVFSGGERIGVDAMDNKIKIEEYMRSLPLLKAVYLHTAFFYENVATKRGTRRVKVRGGIIY